MATWPLLLAVALIIIPSSWFLVLKYLTVSYDSREPPLVSSRIPIIGHLLGLLGNSHNYFNQLSTSTNLPIFRVDIVNFPIYVVTNAKLVASVQRNSKTLTFEPFVYWALKAMAGVSPAGVDAASKPHVSSDLLKSIRTSLYPGPALNEMNRAMVVEVNKFLDGLKGKYEEKPLCLAAWIQHVMTQASTGPVYGRQNPYANRVVEDSFWTKEVELLRILIPVAWLRRLLARRGLSAQEIGTAALERYYHNNGHLDGASLMTRLRFEDLTAAGMSVRDIAAAENLNTGAVVGNTVPTAFWLVYTIYSRPRLLAELRAELDTHLVITSQNSGDDKKTTVYTFDAAVLKDACPLLLSVFQEVLRTRSLGTNNRYVEEDTLILNGDNGQYLLKKGSFIQMPSSSLHLESLTWGPDAASFNPYRFMPGQPKKAEFSSSAVRSFGGGDHLCPGRFFATTEICAFTAVLLLRYDLVPCEGGGEWKEPDVNHKMFTPSIRPPLQDVEVFVRPRTGLDEDGEWILKLSDGRSEFDLASG